MLSDLSDEAQRHAEQGQWGQYRNVRYDTAEYVRNEGQWKRAGFLYLEVLIFDLQGVTSTPHVDGFHETHQNTSPAVIREVARFAIRADIGREELKTVYDRVAGQVWMDGFPRSKEEMWADIRAQVWAEREAIQLDERVEALGTGELLTEAEARTFIERKNEYEIIRRVEQLLETEHPARIPADKRDRVETYLASLNPESLGSRWKAKVYRRGGEVMLSQNGKEKALEYFEYALKAVDQDELAEVERLVTYLRRELNGQS